MKNIRVKKEVDLSRSVLLASSVESVYCGHQFILLLGSYLFSVTLLLLIHREMSTTSREHSMLERIICFLGILRSTFSLSLQERMMPNGMRLSSRRFVNTSKSTTVYGENLSLVIMVGRIIVIRLSPAL